MAAAKAPPLGLSLLPTYPSTAGPSRAARRITSWGSAVSDSGSGSSQLSISHYGDHDMTPLPSPINVSYIGGWDRQDTDGSKWADVDASRDRWREPSGGSDSSSGGGGPGPSRSKTASFFSDGDALMNSLGALSPPPNPPSRSNSLRSGTASSRRSWLDSDDGNSSTGNTSDQSHSTAPSLQRRESDSPENSPTLSPSPTSVRLVPTFDLSSLPPAPELPSPPDAPTPRPTATRPVLPALQTTMREAQPAGSPLSTRPLSSLPSAVEPPTRLARFLHTVAPTSSGSLDVPSGHSTPAGGRSGTTTPRGVSPGTPDGSRPMTPCSWHGDDEQDECLPVEPGERVGEFEVLRLLGKGAFSRVALAQWKGKGKEGEEDEYKGERGVVALKLITRESYEGNDRMRISVEREVEVLRRIHHPSLVSLSSAFTTPRYTVLALDYAPGGELFDFLAAWHRNMTEPLARRMFGELCSAVGWMHSIGLVHRDIKLENILLTSRPFPSLDPSSVLSTLPTPFLKLTDFGLSRFITPDAPLLSTRCGSEAYAAPELIMGKKYDGRRTDAWALGVVLYALITGGMPFVEDADGRGRKGYLLKIAKAEFRWPSTNLNSPQPFSPSPSSSLSSPATGVGSHGAEGSIRIGGAELGRPTMMDAARLVTPSVKALVAKLLVRDPEKRIKVDDVWGMEWMQGEGRPERTVGWVSPREGDGEGRRRIELGDE